MMYSSKDNAGQKPYLNMMELRSIKKIIFWSSLWVMGGVGQALSTGSLMCIYNYTPNAYTLKITTLDEFDWGDAENRPDRNLTKQTLRAQREDGSPGLVCAHFEVNYWADLPWFDLTLVKQASGEEYPLKLVFLNSSKDHGPWGEYLWYSEQGSILNGAPNLELHYQGGTYFAGVTYFETKTTVYSCHGHSKTDQIVDYRSFYEGNRKWRCSAFYLN